MLSEELSAGRYDRSDRGAIFLSSSLCFFLVAHSAMSGGAFARYDNSDREEVVNFFFAMLAYFGGSYGREV